MGWRGTWWMILGLIGFDWRYRIQRAMIVCLYGSLAQHGYILVFVYDLVSAANGMTLFWRWDGSPGGDEHPFRCIHDELGHCSMFGRDAIDRAALWSYHSMSEKSINSQWMEMEIDRSTNWADLYLFAIQKTIHNQLRSICESYPNKCIVWNICCSFEFNFAKGEQTHYDLLQSQRAGNPRYLGIGEWNLRLGHNRALRQISMPLW